MFSSALLPWKCDHKKCQAAKATSQCTKLGKDDELNMKKLVIRRTEAGSWMVECRRFLKVVLPKVAGGTPGRRTLGDEAAERGRLESDSSIETGATGTGATVTTTNIKVPKVTGDKLSYTSIQFLKVYFIFSTPDPKSEAQFN